MRSLFLLYAADLRDKEASQQVESTQLAAAEIERLAEDKQRLAEHLQQEVHALPHFFNPVFFFFFVPWQFPDIFSLFRLINVSVLSCINLTRRYPFPNQNHLCNTAVSNDSFVTLTYTDQQNKLILSRDWSWLLTTELRCLSLTVLQPITEQQNWLISFNESDFKQMSDNNLLLDPGNDSCSGWRNATLSVTVFSKGYAHPNNHSKRSMTSVFFFHTNVWIFHTVLSSLRAVFIRSFSTLLQRFFLDACISMSLYRVKKIQDS